MFESKKFIARGMGSIALALVAMFTDAALAVDLRVSMTGLPLGQATGESWALAYRHLSEAINVAN